MTFHVIAYARPVVHPVSTRVWLLSIGQDEEARAVAHRIKAAHEPPLVQAVGSN